MSIRLFPNKQTQKVRKVSQRKFLIPSDSDSTPYINHQYIKEIMEHSGYKREKDELVLALRKLGIDI